jgi:hypothetical protein
MDARLQAQVWRRAHNRCEYCQFPARLTPVPFQIDHIIAEKHGGATISREKSPYLLQHQHNPVDWYPWGEEGLRPRARKTSPFS